MSFARGHKKREGSAVPLPAERLRRHLVAVEVLPDSVMYSPDVVDQAQTSTCFACTPAVALAETLRLAGTPLDWPISMLDLSKIVRGLERAANGDTTVRLTDSGGDPADVITAVSVFGVCAIDCRTADEHARKCDCSPEDPTATPPDTRLNDNPTVLGLERDAETLLVGMYALDTIDPGLAVRRALASKIIPTFAWCVIDADESAGPDTVLDADPARAVGSNHDTIFVGYRKMPDGSFQYRLQNSWGTLLWGDAGRVWVTEAFLRQADCLYATLVRRAS